MNFRNIICSLTTLALLNACNIVGGSKNVIITQDCNPNRTLKAALFMNLGDATLDYSIHLSVINCKDDLNSIEAGNIFVADSDHNKMTINSSYITFKWQSSDTLQINYDNRLRIFKQQAKFQDVIIIYKKKQK